MSYTTLTAAEMESKYDNLLSNIVTETKQDNNGTIINILTDYDWALNAREISHSKRIPAVYVNEYRQKLSTFSSSLKYAFTGISTSIDNATEYITQNSSATSSLIEANTEVTSDNLFNQIVARSGSHLSPYFNMYSLDSTNCLKYVFPYFTSSAFNVGNTYNDKPQSGGANLFNRFVEPPTKTTGRFGLAAEQINEIIGVIDAFGDNSSIGDEGIYIERPKYFQYSETAETVVVDFFLYNTVVNNPETSAWKKNYRFIKNFTLKNLPYKISYFSYKTPALYEVSIPGIKYFPISFISNIAISNIGMARYLKYSATSQVLVPEAWKVSITFQSLLNPSANILASAFNKGPEIDIITNPIDGIDGKSTMKDPTDKMV